MIFSYNPEDYRQPTSADSASNYSSNSQDSSQSTTSGNLENTVSSRIVKLRTTTPVSNQVHMYDLSTRREDQYAMPARVVEKVNINTEVHYFDQLHNNQCNCLYILIYK